MGTKQIVQDLLQKLPEDLSLHEVVQEIEFVPADRQRLAEIDRGKRIPIEEIALDSASCRSITLLAGAVASGRKLPPRVNGL